MRGCVASHRNLRAVYDRDVRREEGPRDTGLLQPRGERGVELAIGIHLAAQQVVARHLGLHRLDPPLLLVHELAQLGLVLQGAAVLAADRLDHASHLLAELSPDLGDVLAEALQARILRLEGLAQLAVLALERGRLLLEVGDERVLQDRGQGVHVRAPRLGDQALLGDPLGPGLEEGLGHGDELLPGQRLALARAVVDPVGGDEQDVVRLEKAGQLGLRRLEGSARLVDVGRQRLRGVTRRLHPVIELLGDERLGDAIGHARGQLGVAALERHLDQPRVADRGDLEAIDEGVEQLSPPRIESPKLGLVGQLEPVDDPGRERATLQQLEVGLELHLARVPLRVFPHDLLELDDTRPLAIDAESRARREHRSRGEGPGRRGEEDAQEDEEHRSAMTNEDPPVVPEVRVVPPRAQMDREGIERAQSGRRYRKRAQRRRRQLGRHDQIPFATPRAPLKKSMNP